MQGALPPRAAHILAAAIDHEVVLVSHKLRAVIVVIRPHAVVAVDEHVVLVEVLLGEDGAPQGVVESVIDPIEGEVGLPVPRIVWAMVPCSGARGCKGVRGGA